MISLIWLLSILAYLVVNVRTDTSQNKDVQPLRCYSCARVDNMTDCHLYDSRSQVKCPPERPYCGTVTKSPANISSLVCTAGSQRPCTLIQTAKDTYEMTCTCDRPLCNKPFIREFLNEVLNFSSSNSPDNTTTGLLELFMNSSVFVNITSANLYEAITMTMIRGKTKVSPVSPPPLSLSTVLLNAFNNVNGPRAEALKNEATVPSDDDEDEGEGSGSFEEVKPQAPAAPAAPSSFLPANENTASLVHINLLTIIPFISLYTML